MAGHSILEYLGLEDLCSAGRQSLVYFSVSSIVFTISLFSSAFLGFTSELWGLTFWGPALYFCLLNFFLRYYYRGFLYEVAVRSSFLGAVFATGLYLSTCDNGLKVFGLYTMFLSGFHFSEFFAMAYANPKTLNIDSFILNHSIEYAVAAVSSWVEFFIEYYFFPGMKKYYWLSYIGVVMCICGEMMRKGAMVTAKTNFTHVVQFERDPEHQLVTHGIYSMCRHPSYVGWFYWSIGTQITLLNPVCTIVYAASSWFFFYHRITGEELMLLSFFGQEYQDYQEKVTTGLPWIKGYVVPEQGINFGDNDNET